MALAVDASTPAIVTSSSTTVSTLTTGSFTPPAGSLLLVLWSANSTSGLNPAAPSITDSLGVPLTYTQTDWQSRANAPTVNGQAAAWWAVVGSSTAMTVTVTTGITTSSERQQALAVVVLTGQHATPIGAHGKSGSTSAASIAQSYTAQATGGWGFLAACDWDAKGTDTAGTGCTLLPSGSGTIPTTQISYAFERRTSADDTNGVSNTLNLTLPATSTNLSWVYVEVVPAAATASGAIEPLVVTQALKPSGPNQAIVRRNTLADPPVLTTPAPLVVTQPAKPALGNQGYVWRNTLVDPPVLTTPAPLVVSQPAKPTGPNQAYVSRSSLVDVVVTPTTTPGPLVVTQAAKPSPPGPTLLSRNTLADPPVLTTPGPLVVTQPAKPAFGNQALLSRSSLFDLTTPSPLVVTAPAKAVLGNQALLFRSSLVDAAPPPPATTTPGPLVVTPPFRWAWVGPPLVMGAQCICVVLRPSTGATVRPGAGTTARPGSGTTSRPNSGITARPNTGITEEPCC